MQAATYVDPVVLAGEPADVLDAADLRWRLEHVRRELQELAAVEREMQDALALLRARMARCERMLHSIAPSGSLASPEQSLAESTNREHAPTVSAPFLDQLTHSRGASPAWALPHPHPATTCPARLTPRELDVLRLLAAGKSNREIAQALFLSVRTVERHIANLYGKIDARGRADATAFAIHHRLV